MKKPKETHLNSTVRFASMLYGEAFWTHLIKPRSKDIKGPGIRQDSINRTWQNFNPYSE